MRRVCALRPSPPVEDSTSVRARSSLIVLLLVAGCERGGDAGKSPALPAGFGPVDPVAPVQATTPVPPVTPVSYPQPCHPIYAEDAVPSFSLTIEPDHLALLRADRFDPTWRPAVFEYEGDRWDVMVKNRGNSPCGTKLQLGISFNRTDPDARFHGLRKLLLDHGHCRVLDERLVLDFVRKDLGQPAACANHAALWVNGEYEGVYTNLEAINKDWLRRNFGPADDDGNLWKEGSELETNEETGTRDRLQDYKNAETLDELEEMVDVEHAVKYWAFEAVIPASDNFYVDGWNYFLYEHPTRGMVYVPRDYDKAMPWAERFIEFDPMLIDSRHFPVPNVLGASAFWRDEFVREMYDVLDKYDPEVFRERRDRYWEQIRSYAADDPNLPYGPGSPPPAYLVDNVRARVQWLEANLPPAPESD